MRLDSGPPPFGRSRNDGIGYLFERGKKRQHRLQAAKDQTAVTRSQVDDSQRQLIFNTSQQFIAVLLAQSARFVDLDGPLLLAKDRDGGLRYEESLIYPPDVSFWG